MSETIWPDFWADVKIAAIDVETTGFSFEEDRVIEVGIVTFQGGEVIDSWGSLVNPHRPIPQVVVELTGIKDEDVATAPSFEAVAGEIEARLQGAAICAYNLKFDRNFVSTELTRAGHAWPEDAPTLDPLIFARELHKEEKSKKLGAVAERLGLTLENAHRATDDAKVAGEIMYAFAGSLPKRLQDLLVLQAQWEVQQEQAMAAWKSRRSFDDGPSAALQAVSAMGGQAAGLGPAYLFGQELDPLRAIYSTVPEVNR